MSHDSPIFAQTYDLLLWLLALLAQFPREHRGGLGRRIADTAFSFQSLLISASKQPEHTAGLLGKADVALAELRLLLRLARDLQILSFAHYEDGARRSTELGRLLGGWLRSVERAIPGQAAVR